MRMQPLENIVVPAEGSAMLEQGGMHVMLMGVQPLEEGDTFELNIFVNPQLKALKRNNGVSNSHS